MKLNRRNMAGATAAALAASVMGMAKGSAAFACDDDGLASAVEAFRVAMVNADGPRMTELAADYLSFGHSNGVVQTREEFVAAVVEKKEIFNSISQTENHNIVVNDLGIARHKFTANITIDGQAKEFNLGILQVWHKEAGQWKMVARQAFKPPQA
jgi:hypothetical protein